MPFFKVLHCSSFPVVFEIKKRRNRNGSPACEYNTEQIRPIAPAHNKDKHVPAGLLALVLPTLASSRLRSDFLRFRSDYSGGAAPALHRIPILRNVAY